MEFDEIVVKESPGLCRCCLSEGCYKDLGSEYTWMNEAEVYADMLLECFDISITQHNEGPNGPSRLICEVCITRLRDACNFKKQVLDSEKKFIDMLGRGEFRPKVLIYQTQMKTENSDEQVQEEVEYLEDDLDFDDDEVLKPSVDEHSSSPLETVTSETISLKRKLKTKKTKISRPKKHVEVDEKPKSSKAVSKGPRAIANAEESLKIKHLRDALKVILEHTTAVPFERHGNYHKCFFCETVFQHAAELINHSQSHTSADLDAIDAFDEPVIKIDVTDLACKICSEHLHFKDLLTHLEKKHDVEINRKAADSIICFKLTDSDFKCLICEKLFKIFGTLLLHIHREHLKCNLFCEACGESFATNQDLVRHTINSHSFGNCKCEYCDRKFINIHRRDRHVKLKHNVSYSCQYCNKIFKKASQRDRHINQIHSLQIHPTHKCDRCSMVFKKKLTLSYHYKKVHLKQKNVTCEVCGMTFFDTRNLNLHKVRHAGDKPFECDTCHKKFTRKPALKLHVRIHTDERRYVCKMCGRAFVQWSALDGHLHIHSDERNFKCLICDKAFKTKKTLRKHSLTVHQKGSTRTVHQDL